MKKLLIILSLFSFSAFATENIEYLVSHLKPFTRDIDVVGAQIEKKDSNESISFHCVDRLESNCRKIILIYKIGEKALTPVSDKNGAFLVFNLEKMNELKNELYKYANWRDSQNLLQQTHPFYLTKGLIHAEFGTQILLPIMFTLDIIALPLIPAYYARLAIKNRTEKKALNTMINGQETITKSKRFFTRLLDHYGVLFKGLDHYHADYYQSVSLEVL